ncbi:MAG: tyrosine-type recombinase/integrase [Lachnospiraceae bacterium]
MTESEWLKHGYEMGVVEPDVVASETFGQVYHLWLSIKAGQRRNQTIDRIECTYKRYFVNNVIDFTQVALINDAFLIDWLNNILVHVGKMSYKEFCRITQIVRGVQSYAKDLELVGVTVLDWDKILRYMPSNRIEHGKKDDVAITRQDIDKLFHAVLIEDIYPLKESACLCLLANFYLGLRVGELAALRWSDVDFDRKSISVCRTEVKYFERDEDMHRMEHMTYKAQNELKTLSSVRVVPMCNECIYILDRLKKYQLSRGYDDGRLAYDGGQTILVRSLDRTMRRLCKMCEIPLYNTHRIRKTTASYLHDSGVPLKTISMLLGHSDVSTTARYYLRNTIDDKHLLEMVNGAFEELVDLK